MRRRGMKHALGIVLVLLFAAVPISALDTITQGEAAVLLVRAMGLAGDLPPGTLPSDYMDYLTDHFITPLEGWKPNSRLTLGELAVLLVRAMGLEGEIPEKSDTDSYIALLVDKGLLTEGLSTEVVSADMVIDTLVDPVFSQTAAKIYLTPISPILP